MKALTNKQAHIFNVDILGNNILHTAAKFNDVNGLEFVLSSLIAMRAKIAQSPERAYQYYYSSANIEH